MNSFEEDIKSERSVEAWSNNDSMSQPERQLGATEEYMPDGGMRSNASGTLSHSIESMN